MNHELFIDKTMFDGFSKDVQEIIKLMSYPDKSKLKLFGSMSMRSQQYASDYDLYQIVKLDDNNNIQALKKLANGFRNIVANLLNHKNVYIGDIKAGLIEEWIVIPDNVKIEHNKVVNYNYLHSLTRLETLFRKNIITKTEFETSKELLVLKPSPEELLVMKNEIKFHVVRWKPSDVKNGYVVLRNHAKMTLEEAFNCHIITKLDVCAWINNNKYSDFSIIYEFKNKDINFNNENWTLFMN